MPGTWTSPPAFTVNETVGVTAGLNILSGNENYLNNQLNDELKGSTGANFNFTSISSAYSHLLLISVTRGDNATASSNANLTFNGDTGANYDNTYYGQSDVADVITNIAGASAASGNTNLEAFAFPANTAPNNEFGAQMFLIFNYASTTQWKHLVGLWGWKRAATGQDGLGTGTTFGIWRSNSAINRITLKGGSSSFVAGSRCTLYGLY